MVWIDLATGKVVAEQQINGYRTDHMNVSPDGLRLLVSDSTDRSVHEYVMGGKDDPATGTELRTFESGDTPHESNYSKNGKRIFHASIGRVYTPVDYPELGLVPVGGVHDTVKADRWFQIVDNQSFKVKRRWDMGKELAEAGFANMSSAVRPMAITTDEKTAFLQVSFFHRIVEFKLRKKDRTGGGDYSTGGQPEPSTGKVKRLIPLPISDEAAALSREDYVLDSAHHGIAINKRGTRLCVAGTMSDYAAIVSRKSGRYKVFDGAAKFLENREYSKPYWATTSQVDGNCWVSMAGSDLVLVIDYGKRRVIDEIAVGEHPQRVRDGLVSRLALKSWAAGGASSVPNLSPVPITPAQSGGRCRLDGRPDRGHQLALSYWSGVGALAVVGLLLLRARRLRPVLLIVILRGFGNGPVSQGGPHAAKSRCSKCWCGGAARVLDRRSRRQGSLRARCAAAFGRP